MRIHRKPSVKKKKKITPSTAQIWSCGEKKKVPLSEHTQADSCSVKKTDSHQAMMPFLKVSTDDFKGQNWHNL